MAVNDPTTSFEYPLSRDFFLQSPNLENTILQSPPTSPEWQTPSLSNISLPMLVSKNGVESSNLIGDDTSLPYRQPYQPKEDQPSFNNPQSLSIDLIGNLFANKSSQPHLVSHLRINYRCPGSRGCDWHNEGNKNRNNNIKRHKCHDIQRDIWKKNILIIYPPNLLKNLLS